MSGPIFHTEFEQNSAAWFQIRAGKLTASEMHRVITPGKGEASKSAGPFMMRLIAERILDRSLADEDSYQSELMKLGHENEAATVAAFEFQTDLKTSTVGFVERADGLMGCSPDRIIEGLGTLEVKSPAAPTQVSYLLDESSLSREYFLQTQTQLYICEYEFGYICSNHNPLPPVVLKVPRNEVWIEKIETASRVFLEKMLENLAVLEQRFGPFTKPVEPEVKADVFAGMGVSEDDIQYLWMED